MMALTRTLHGVALAWALADVLERRIEKLHNGQVWVRQSFELPGSSVKEMVMPYDPGKDAGSAQTIVEAARIDMRFDRDWVYDPEDPEDNGERWYAELPSPDGQSWCCYGPAPHIAALRCYVLSRRGEEIEIPDELVGSYAQTPDCGALVRAHESARP